MLWRSCSEEQRQLLFQYTRHSKIETKYQRQPKENRATKRIASIANKLSLPCWLYRLRVQVQTIKKKRKRNVENIARFSLRVYIKLISHSLEDYDSWKFTFCEDTNSFFHSIEENHATVLKHNFSFLKWKFERIFIFIKDLIYTTL